MSETTIYKEGFNAGFMQLRQIDVEAATKELWQALRSEEHTSELQSR